MSRFRSLPTIIIATTILLFAGLFVWHVYLARSPEKSVTFFVNYNNTSVATHTALENTLLSEALEKAGYEIESDTLIFPLQETALKRGEIIHIQSPKQFTLKDQNREEQITKAANTVQEALEQSGIALNGADFVEPELAAALSHGMTVKITRVMVTEETEEAKIAFKKIEEEDDTLSWRTKKIAQKGENGVKTTVYKVSRHNDTVVAQEKIREEVTKEPVDQKTVIGTKVTVVKKHTGGASWYAHTGTLAAANPWLPFGSYVRVTNTGNGKSVIVRINDRGPFGGGRIIDLDKVAFAKIADLGTGVINVLMEEIQ